MEQTNQFRTNHRSKPSPEGFQLEEIQGLRVSPHACRASKRALQQANEHFRRANRDLGELAAFIAASLTTLTAVEAVINIAIDKLGLAREMLQVAFDGYILLLAATLLLGGIRFGIVMRRRALAEKEIDQANQNIYRFCAPEEWPKPEE